MPGKKGDIPFIDEKKDDEAKISLGITLFQLLYKMASQWEWNIKKNPLPSNSL